MSNKYVLLFLKLVLKQSNLGFFCPSHVVSGEACVGSGGLFVMQVWLMCQTRLF